MLDFRKPKAFKLTFETYFFFWKILNDMAFQIKNVENFHKRNENYILQNIVTLKNLKKKLFWVTASCVK